jgi:hypothetical protein
MMSEPGHPSDIIDCEAFSNQSHLVSLPRASSPGHLRGEGVVFCRKEPHPPDVLASVGTDSKERASSLNGPTGGPRKSRRKT